MVRSRSDRGDGGDGSVGGVDEAVQHNGVTGLRSRRRHARARRISEPAQPPLIRQRRVPARSNVSEEYLGEWLTCFVFTPLKSVCFAYTTLHVRLRSQRRRWHEAVSGTDRRHGCRDAVAAVHLPTHPSRDRWLGQRRSLARRAMGE